jgi:hypothetical protein
MDEQRKADLTYLLSKIAAVVHNFHGAAVTIGVEGLMDCADRASTFLERCEELLRQGKDFSKLSVQEDALARLDHLEAERNHLLEVTHALKRELEEQRTLRYLSSHDVDFWQRVEVFERASYARVQADLQTMDLWIADRDGKWLVPTEDGTLLGAIQRLRKERVAATNNAWSDERPPRPPPIQSTTHPQDFRVEPESLPPINSEIPAFSVPPLSEVPSRDSEDEG